MEITDIVIQSHIVSEGNLTAEQLIKLEQLIEGNPNVTFEEITNMLKEQGLNIVHQHSNDLEVGMMKQSTINENDLDYLELISDLVKNMGKKPSQTINL